MEHRKYKFPVASVFFIIYGIVSIWGQLTTYSSITKSMGGDVSALMRWNTILQLMYLGCVILLGIMLIALKDSYLLLIPTIGMSLYECIVITMSFIPDRNDGIMYMIQFNFSGVGLLIFIYHILMLAGHIILVSIVVIGKIKGLKLLIKYTWWNAPVIYLIARLFRAGFSKKMLLEPHEISFFRFYFVIGGIEFVFILGTFLMGKFLAHPYKEEITEA